MEGQRKKRMYLERGNGDKGFFLYQSDDDDGGEYNSSAENKKKTFSKILFSVQQAPIRPIQRRTTVNCGPIPAFSDLSNAYHCTGRKPGSSITTLFW